MRSNIFPKFWLSFFIFGAQNTIMHLFTPEYMAPFANIPPSDLVALDIFLHSVSGIMQNHTLVICSPVSSMTFIKYSDEELFCLLLLIKKKYVTHLMNIL